MKTVSMLNDKTFRVEFSYDPTIVAQVRCLPPGRRWVPELHAWTCPASVDALRDLREWGFEIKPDVIKWEQAWFKPAKPTVRLIDDIPGLKRKLYPFQAEGVGFIENRGGRVLIGDEMGLGKTVQALAWLQHKGNPALPAVVVCPASLKGNWERECREWTTLSPCVLSGTKPHIPPSFEKRDTLYIINYDILHYWMEILNRVCSTVVLDECFSFHTPIITDKGWLLIGDIVERNLKVKCLSYDFSKKKLYFKPIIRYIKNQKAKTIIKIKWKNGTITCSPNHKIWEMSANEYKTADKIKTGNVLRMVQENPCKKMETVLLSFMRRFLEHVNSRVPRKNTFNSHEETTISIDPLQLVQKMDSTVGSNAWEKIKTILQHILFRSLENESTRNKETNLLISESYSGKAIRTNKKSTFEKSTMGYRQFRKNEEKQSIPQPNNCQKNETDKDTQWDSTTMERHSWWEWILHRSANNAVRLNQRKNGILCKHKTSNKFNQKPSKKLQDRHSPTREENCNRSRWWQSFESDQSKIGPEKRFCLTNVRVESIEILESRDNEQSASSDKQNQFLYNLEIQDTHNYFANGILVSNCHFIKNQKAQRTKATKEFCKNKRYVIGLSGTPIKSRPIEFYNFLNLIAPSTFNRYWDYVQRYCDAKHNGFGWDLSGASNVEELHQRLNGTCLPYETIVYSEKGLRQIGDIVKNEEYIKVLSVNPKTSEIQWKQVVAHSARIAPRRMLRIKHEYGELCCTPNHLIFTKKGCIRAERIVPGILLSVLQNQNHTTITQQEHHSKILFYQMRRSPSGTNRRVKKENDANSMGASTNLHNGKKVSPVQQENIPSITCLQQRQKMATQKILLPQMCNEMDTTPSHKKYNQRSNKSRKDKERTSTYCQSNSSKRSQTRETHLLIGTDQKQGYQTKAIQSTNKKMEKGQNTRQDTSILANFSLCQETPRHSEMAGTVVGKENPLHKSKWIVPKRSSELSCSGHCSTGSKTCHRSRRLNPQRSKTKGKRRLERTGIKTSRVVSITNYERRNQSRHQPCSGKDYVYDIQVEENHNFFANGCLVHNCMIRRLKADVLKDLPEKTRTTVPLELNGNEGIYTSALREALGAWQDEKPDPLKDITHISALRQAAMDAKFDLCCEWIDNFLETGRKLVVFDVHHKTTDRLMEKYGKVAVALDGRVDSRLRSKVVEQFQTDQNTKLLIGNVQVAGTGFTMTAAQDAVFLEYPWTPGELAQAEDRIHRIGQKGATSIYYLVAKNTLEEDILELIEEKRKVLNGVLDGQYDESTSILAELTKRLKQKGKQK